MTSAALPRSRAAATCAVVALVLGGCETQSTRACPAFVGHPDLEAWAPYVAGDVLTYASDRGETESYTLRSIERSEGFEEREFGDRDDIRCSAEAEHLFELSTETRYLSIEYSVVEEVGVALPDQPLYAFIQALETPTSVSPSFARFRYLLTDPLDQAGNNSTDEQEVSFTPSREVGQVTYDGVFETITNASAIDREAPPETTLTRVVFARGGGLVEFERSDGQTFTLVPP